MSAGELISVHVGGSGIRIGEAFWKLNCQEFGVDLGGKQQQANQIGQSTYFRNISGKYRPRAIFADLNGDDISHLKSFEMKDLFNPNLFKYGNSDSCVWASGHYTDGAEMVDNVMTSIRNEANVCDNLKGFLIFSSISGGSGGGLGSLITSKLKEEFPDKTHIGMHMVMSPKSNSYSVEPYNNMLSLHQ